MKDKHKGLAFKKILEDATQFLSGPSQISYDEESLSESFESAVSDEQFDDTIDFKDSGGDSDSEWFINLKISFGIQSLLLVLKFKVYYSLL